MTHFGLLCPSFSGHLNPMTTLGYELKQRGHHVTFVGTLDAQPKVLAAGLAFQPIGEKAFPAGATLEASAQLGQLSGLAAFRYTAALFSQTTRTLLQEAPAAIQTAGIESLIIDQTSFGGLTVAQTVDIPFVSICCALMLNREPNIPPFNTPWPYHPTGWSRLRNQAGYELLEIIAKPIWRWVDEYRQQSGLPPCEKVQRSLFSTRSNLSAPD